MSASATRTTAVRGRRPMTFEEWASYEGEEHIEWVAGEAVPMMAISEEHSRVSGFLLRLLGEFCAVTGAGEVHADPFGMRVTEGGSGRDPDIQVIRTEHLHRLRGTYTDGPADLVVEVISPGRDAVDRVEKFHEYESGGVPEYWLINPHRQTFEAYVLEAGRYRLAFEGAEGEYTPRELPGLRLRVEWCWSQPSLLAIAAEAGLI